MKHTSIRIIPVGIIRDIYYFDTFKNWTFTDCEKSGFKTGETPDFIKGELRDELSTLKVNFKTGENFSLKSSCCF